MCRSLIKAGWTLNDIEESDFETLIDVICSENKEQRIDLVEYMRQKKGLTMG